MLKLKQTCMACPEQYDVFDESGNEVGYIRLRHGYLRVDYPGFGGETIYSSLPEGDGIFAEHERVHFLNECVRAIEARIAGESKREEQPIYEIISLDYD
jgi:hypothetical protein